ncbi:hypothetical protein [Halobellus rufus]|uniref:hypothetical protein n=1 Tax=Halobellus rufus TaxID=1448860 RepID=UPI0006786E1E|nr:hypothetical protein [Halobellus rufus]
MTRFDAADPRERQKLFADAITAHRTRGSAFATMTADHDPDLDGEDSPAPWVQFADKTFNLDVVSAELDRLKDVVDDFPAFRIDQIESPEEAEATNVRITARSDANHLAAFIERVFRDVYERDEEYRAWVTAV